MITWDQTGSYEVEELQAQLQGAGSDDWMTTLLQTNAFHRIPPANIQAIFQRLQRTPCRAGEVVIKQGDEGDYFYIIVQGKCAVTRETPLSREGIKLAELNVGDTFGEEALIAEAKRNATVTMMTDGVLMRLNKQDFRELMNEPLLQWVTHEQSRKIARARRALARCAPAERAPEPRHRGRAQCAAVSDPAEALDPRSHQALHRLLRYRAPQFRGRLHPGRARLRRLCAQGRTRQRWRGTAADARRGRRQALDPARAQPLVMY